MPPLNTLQRLFLAAVGIAIFLFQLYRFSEYGVEGSGWIFAFLIAALLLLPALGLMSSSRSSQLFPQKPSTGNNDRVSTAQARVEGLVARAIERAKVLHRQLPILIDLPPMQAPELRGINALMTDSWLQYCIAYVGCLSLMTEWKKRARFIKQPEYSVVWQLLVNEMVKADAQTSVKHGLQSKYDMQKSMQWATRDMNEAEFAMKKFVDRLASNIPEPDAPMISFLMDKIGAPEQVRASLSIGIRNFTRETLQQFAAM
jgi:hypothetical protein